VEALQGQQFFPAPAAHQHHPLPQEPVETLPPRRLLNQQLALEPIPQLLFQVQVSLEILQIHQP